MTGNDPDSLGFAAVPFALEWLCPAAEWYAEPARLVVSAPAQTDWFIDPISARPVRTAPLLVGPAPSGDFTWEAHVVLDGDAMFDAAGLFVHGDDNHWAKLAVEVTAAGPTIV
jgi:regulation of enolase protein 1 (concanavalin A-like superfamily)